MSAPGPPGLQELLLQLGWTQWLAGYWCLYGNRAGRHAASWPSTTGMAMAPGGGMVGHTWEWSACLHCPHGGPRACDLVLGFVLGSNPSCHVHMPLSPLVARTGVN
jgi:hypothetical protein